MNLKVLTAIGLGGFLQFYNVYLVSYFVVILLDHFFSATQGTFFYIISLIAWVIIRPLSSFYFGPRGDRKSRKSMLALSMMLMALATFLIGFIPTESQIGIAATVLLIFFMFVQGFAFGGEYGGAVSLLIEYAPSNKRGLYASWIFFTSFLGILFVELMTSWFYEMFSSAFMSTWGWRILFFLGIFLAVPAICLRTSISDSPAFLKIKPLKHPMKHLFSNHGKELLLGIGLCIGPAVTTGFHFDFLSIFLVDFVGLSTELTYLLLAFTTVIFLIFVPIMGATSDKIGRKIVFFWGAIVFFWGAIATAVLDWPLFQLVQYIHPIFTIIVLFFYGFFAACMYGALGSFLGELFPTKVRYSGFTLSSNIGVGIFESIIPMIALYSIHYFDLYISSILVTIACLITVLCLYFSKETAFKPLKED